MSVKGVIISIDAYRRIIYDDDSASTHAAARDAVICRAQGVLMERYGCDAAESFDIMLDLAGRELSGVYTIAALILQQRGM